MGDWASAHAARLRILAREWGTQAQLAAATDIPIATLQRILGGKADPGPDRLARICDAIGESVDAIMKPGPAGDGIFEVPIADIRVSAGPGALASDQERRLGGWPFPRDWIEAEFRYPAKLRVVKVSGDSQEPELRDGDNVLIDLSRNQLAEGMHVVRLDDVLMIKRVQLEGARVRLKSANARYDDIIVDLASAADQFAVVGRAVWAGKSL